MLGNGDFTEWTSHHRDRFEVVIAVNVAIEGPKLDSRAQRLDHKCSKLRSLDITPVIEHLAKREPDTHAFG